MWKFCSFKIFIIGLYFHVILEEEKRKFIVEDLKAPNKTGRNKPLEKKAEGETSQPWTLATPAAYF